MRAEYRRRREQLVDAVAGRRRDDRDGDACGATRDARARPVARERAVRERAWRRLGVEGLDCIATPRPVGDRDGLVIGYASPAPSAWSAALDALTGQLP